MNNYISCTVENGIAMIIINRPEAMNALNQDVLCELCDTMDSLNRNPEVKVAIITGSGQKAFVAGADISVMRDMTPDEAKTFSRLGHKAMDKIEGTPVFVIAAVNGFALGGGCELALACDMRVASTKARFGIPETTLGLIPGFGGTQRLPRIVGVGRAKELMATGRQVNAEEAKRIGLVNDVTAPEDLLSRCLEFAEQIAANSTIAVAYGKKAMNAGMDMPLADGLELEAETFGLAFLSPDKTEGTTAFLEHRRPRFSGHLEPWMNIGCKG